MTTALIALGFFLTWGGLALLLARREDGYRDVQGNAWHKASRALNQRTYR